MKSIRVLAFIILNLGILTNTIGQTNAPKFSNEFLAIGVSARALSMSNAQVSQVSDVTSGYWNPAGLLNIESKYEGSIMHAEYFAGIAKFDYAGFATPIDTFNHLAISVIRFAIDDIPDTRFLYDANGRLNYDNIRFFSAADYAFIFSYAHRPKDIKGLKLGGNLKIINRNVGNFANAWGFGLDAGAQLSVQKWNLGLMMRDITGTFNAWTHNTELIADIFTQTGNTIPNNSVEITLPKAILGVSRGFRYKKFGLLVAMDADLTFDGKRNVPIKSEFISIDPHLGMEFDYKQLVYMRFGVGQFQQVKDFDSSQSWTFQPNFGVGVKLNNVIIDYALSDIGDQAESPYSHIFSISAAFKEKGK